MKVTRIECDKCGKLLDELPGSAGESRNKVVVQYSNIRQEVMTVEIDLCDTHFGEFKKFIKESNGK